MPCFFQQNTKRALNNKNDVLMTGEYFQHTYRSMEGVGVYKFQVEFDINWIKMCVAIYTHLCLEKKTEGKFPEKPRVSEFSGGQNTDEWF